MSNYKSLNCRSGWLLILTPPTLGGAAVGLLHYVTKGFADPPPASPLRAVSCSACTLLVTLKRHRLFICFIVTVFEVVFAYIQMVAELEFAVDAKRDSSMS